MDMIDRYLNAVAAQLPQDERADIVAELRDLILSRFEAREEELGRALTDDEKEAILHEIGHPLVVAARYRKGPDSLVGPELFPYWLFAVKAGLLLMLAVQAIVLFINLLSGPADAGQSIGHAVNGFISSGLTLIGIVTVVGAVMEHVGYRPGWMSKWRVNELSAFGLADPAAWGAAMGGTEGAKATWAPRSLGRPRGLPARYRRSKAKPRTRADFPVWRRLVDSSPAQGKLKTLVVQNLKQTLSTASRLSRAGLQNKRFPVRPQSRRDFQPTVGEAQDAAPRPPVGSLPTAEAQRVESCP